MDTETHTIETGVDKLVELIKEKKSVTVDEAAKLLSMPRELVEELAGFLEEREVIGIVYKFAVPYLVYKELTREQSEEMAKQFAGRRVGFVRKVDVALQNLEQNSEYLAKLKEEFTKLNKELGEKVIRAKDELGLLSRYEQMKRDIDNQILEQQKEFMESKRAMDAQILSKKKAIASLLSQTTAEGKKLNVEDKLAKLFKVKEDQLEKTLREAAKKTVLIEERVNADRSLLDETIAKIANYRQLNEVAKQELWKQEEALAPMLEESKQHERKIMELRRNFLEKAAAHAQVKGEVSRNQAGKIQAKFKALFQKKANAERLANTLNSDLEEIKKELKALAEEATIVQLTSKSKKVADVVSDFEGGFNKLNKKKEKFQKEVFSLVDQMHKF